MIKHLMFRISKNISERINLYCAEHDMTKGDYIKMAVEEKQRNTPDQLFFQNVSVQECGVTANISEGIHRAIKIRLAQNGMSLQDFGTSAILEKMSRDKLLDTIIQQNEKESVLSAIKQWREERPPGNPNPDKRHRNDPEL